MTIQIADVLSKDGEAFSIIPPTVNIWDLLGIDFQVENIVTSCYRGYYAEFEIRQGALYLAGVNSTSDVLDARFSFATKSISSLSWIEYHGIDTIVPFSGILRLRRRSQNMSFGTCLPIEYVAVFQDGNLLNFDNRLISTGTLGAS